MDLTGTQFHMAAEGQPGFANGSGPLSFEYILRTCHEGYIFSQLANCQNIIWSKTKQFQGTLIRCKKVTKGCEKWCIYSLS